MKENQKKILKDLEDSSSSAPIKIGKKSAFLLGTTVVTFLILFFVDIPEFMVLTLVTVVLVLLFALSWVFSKKSRARQKDRFSL